MNEISPQEQISANGKKTVSFSLAGAIVTGFLASACCIGPLVLVSLGVSSAGALVALDPYRPYFMVLTLFFLTCAFYVTYRKPKVTDGESDETCCNNNKLQKIMLWIAAVFSLAMLFFPQIMLALLG